MRQIAFYGKGGIGKSTIASNLSAALASLGKKVLQVGCDPKQDSTRTLLGGKKIPSILSLMDELRTDSLSVQSFMAEGFNGVKCIEAGGPEPGVGCAGRGIILAIEAMKKLKVYESGFDYVFYDVLGDIVCGGFAVPIREGYAKEVYLVVSGEFMSLYAANNICRAVKRYSQRNSTFLGGIILNMKGIENEELFAKRFAEKVGSEVIGVISRDSLVQEAEICGHTVVERFPDSNASREFFKLSERLQELKPGSIPSPMTEEELNSFFLEFRAK